METDQQEVNIEDFSKERGVYDSIIGEWSTEKNKCAERRKFRKNRRNVDEERTKGTILKDETIIPDRTIDTNIRRGKVPYVNYVVSAKRTLIITDNNNPDTDTEPLELWFTRGMHFPQWKTPWLKLLDAVQTHGGCGAEVVYDTSKPFNCAIEYIPRNALIFPLKTKDLQACPRLLRLYKITVLQLEEMAETYEFDESVVAKLKEKYKARYDMLDIYRILSKKGGIVYSSWYSQENTDGWLRKPAVHQIGLFDYDPEMVQSMQQMPEWEQIRSQIAKPLALSMYPIFWFTFDVTEDEEILNESGRVALDLHVQEALTSLLSSTVNAAYRASNLYPTAENMPGDDPKLGELGMLKPGIISSRKIVLNQFPWPQPVILAVMQAMDIRKAQEAGNQDFAAVARKDANKTKYEMELANSQSEEQSAIGLTVFSTPYLDVCALCFLIATHQAIFGLCSPPTHPELLYLDYNLQPAGDIEVLKRQEDKENAKQFYGLIKGTPMAETLLKFLFERFFPDQIDAWDEAVQISNKTNELKQTLVQLISILQATPTDELTPDQQSGLGAVLAHAQQLVAEPNDAMSTGDIGGPAPTNPQ